MNAVQLLVVSLVGVVLQIASSAVGGKESATTTEFETTANAVADQKPSGSYHSAKTKGETKERRATARTMAQIDLTGYWVSLVTEDWHYRMVSAPRGDFGSIPLNAEGSKVSKTWDPATNRDEIKVCGAAGIMRQPGRLHISWKDEHTLQIEFDACGQTRLIHFSGSERTMQFSGSEIPAELRRAQAPENTGASLQGHSVAAWKKYFDGRGFAGAATGGGRGTAQPGKGGALMVITSHMAGGYLQRNGIPYSTDALLTEYFNRVRLPNGEEWLVVTSIVEDSKYLNEPYVTSTHFQREVDGSKWCAPPCRDSDGYGLNLPGLSATFE